MNIENIIREDLRDFSPYEAAQSVILTEGALRLHANEAPWSWEDNLNRYPLKQSQLLTSKLAIYYQVNNDQLLLTRGSDEAIDLLIRLTCSAGRDNVIITPPTFSMYAVSAKLQGAAVIEVPLIAKLNFKFNVDEIIRRITSETKLIFLCSPNNPTGNVISSELIEKLCAQASSSFIVVDEAYIEFSDQPSVTRLINSFENLVVLRTMSKAFALAGARVGALLASKKLITWLSCIIPPYPLPTLTYITLGNVLRDQNLKRMNEGIQMIQCEREKFEKFLSRLTFVECVYPSQGNFLLVKVGNANNILKYCRDQKIILRDMSKKKGLANCIRITIGSPEQNSQLQTVLNQWEQQR